MPNLLSIPFVRTKKKMRWEQEKKLVQSMENSVSYSIESLILTSIYFIFRFILGVRQCVWLLAEISYLIQFCCVNIKHTLGWLIYSTFFYYISDDNAILKIFSNSLGYMYSEFNIYKHTCIFIFIRTFQSGLLNLKSDSKWNWHKGWGKSRERCRCIMYIDDGRFSDERDEKKPYNEPWKKCTLSLYM